MATAAMTPLPCATPSPSAASADGIMRRARSNRPLSDEEVARNHRLIAPRRQVEKLFGTLKRSYRLERVPHFSLIRNQVTFTLACIAYNLRRLDTLRAT